MTALHAGCVECRSPRLPICLLSQRACNLQRPRSWRARPTLRQQHISCENTNNQLSPYDPIPTDSSWHLQHLNVKRADRLSILTTAPTLVSYISHPRPAIRDMKLLKAACYYGAVLIFAFGRVYCSISLRKCSIISRSLTNSVSSLT